MESPQSSHSSSLWVFALSLRVLSELSPSVPISHLGTKLLIYGFSVVDLRVISRFVSPFLTHLTHNVARWGHKRCWGLVPGTVSIVQFVGAQEPHLQMYREKGTFTILELLNRVSVSIRHACY